MIDFLAGARRLLGRAPADPTDAFRLALGSRYRILARIGLVPEEAQRAVRYFEQAIELEPGFAPAHSGLARRLS